MLQPQLYNNKNHLIPIIKIWDQVILLPNHNILLIYHLQICLQLIITHPYKTFHFKSNHLLLFFIYFIFHNLSFYLLVFHFVVSLIHSQTKKPCILMFLIVIIMSFFQFFVTPLMIIIYNWFHFYIPNWLFISFRLIFLLLLLIFSSPPPSSIFHVIFREFYSVFYLSPFLELNFI